MEASRRTIVGKILSAAAALLTVLILSLCLAPTKAHAEIIDGDCSHYSTLVTSSVYWSLDTDTGALSIYGTGTMGSGNGHKPNAVSWADYSNLIKTVSISSGVTSIQNDAFRGCAALESISLPNTLISLGGYAFYGCAALESIDLPSSLSSITSYAFVGASALKSITIPSSVKYVRESAFKDCTALESVYIEDGSCYELDMGCFQGCAKLSSIRIPDSVTLINDNCFQDCISLGCINLPAALTLIGDYAFSGCTALESIVIPSSVTKIGGNAFAECSSLKDVTFETDAVCTLLGIRAFYSCRSLTSIFIPKSVERIDVGCFSSTPIATISFEERRSYLEVQFDNFNSSSLKNVYFGNATRKDNIGWYQNDSQNTGLTNATWHYDHIHSWTTSEEGRPTCTEGDIDIETCEVCKASQAVRVGALGHSYGSPTITFADNQSSATATWTCEHDITHVETAACTVTSEITKAATCETAGDTTYTATVAANEAKGLPAGSSSITLADIPAQGHEYVDGVCTRCGFLFGDVNASGAINIVDAQIAYDLSRGRYREHDYFNILWARANVNGDETVDAADARALQCFVHYGRMGN